MKTTKLGDNGPDIFRIGLGCMGMSDFYGDAEDEKSIRVIHHALDKGVNFLDTADMYGVGKNEKLVGRAIKDRRDQVVLATKFGILRDPTGQMAGVSGKPAYVQQACDLSLQRLGLNHIDLYYQHRVDPETPIEDTVGAMAELVQQGKVRYLGLSEAAPDTIRRAHKIHPITALQTEYSLWTRDPEAELLPLCHELGITFVPYSPLGRGFLTGAIKSIDDLAPDDWRRNNPRFQGENFQRNLELARQVENIAARRNATAAQIALAWLLDQGDDIAPIPGTRSTNRIDENTAAADITLTDEDRTELRNLLDKIPVAGTRYPEAAMSMLNG